MEKLMLNKSHEIGMIIFGTDETSNDLNQQDPSNYKNVTCLRNIDKPNLEFLKVLIAISGL